MPSERGIMTERLSTTASPQELIDSNRRLIKKYLESDKEIIKKAEEKFQELFEKFKDVNHNDQFHGTETLLYHQYMVMHSFDLFMDAITKDFASNDQFINNMEVLLQTIETKTKMGKEEIKNLLVDTPKGCTKNFQTLLFLTVLFHDIGKLYNTEKWEKEFTDETLKLRKFQRHEGYGKSFLKFFMMKKERMDELIDNVINILKNEKAGLESTISALDEKKKANVTQKINLLTIDIYYLSACRNTIKEFKELLDEFELNKGDYRFISDMIEKHHTLLRDASMPYEAYANEKDIKKLRAFLKWAREKKLAKADIQQKNRQNDFIFYGLMFINMSDVNGTGYSDQVIEIAFKNYAIGDKFEGHHGNIKADAEFCGFLNYLYHNIARSDDEIIKDWFGVEEIKKGTAYNYAALFQKYEKQDALEIKRALETAGPAGLSQLCNAKGINMGEIMKVLRTP